MAVTYGRYDPEVLRRVQEVETEELREIIRICEKYDLRYFLMYGSIIGAVRHQGFIPWDDDTDIVLPREDYNRLLEIVETEWGTDGAYELLCPEKPGSYYHLIPRMVKKGTKFITEANAGRYPNAGIAIDIFPLDYAATDPEKRRRQIKKAQLWKNVYMVRNVNFMKVKPLSTVKKFVHIALGLIRGAMIVLQIKPEWIYQKYQSWVFRYPEEKEIRTVFCDLKPWEICSKESEFFPTVQMPYEGLEAALPGNYDALATRIYGDYMTPPPEGKRYNHAPALVEFEDGLRQVNGVVEERKTEGSV